MTLFYFPLGLENFFKNLKMIAIFSSNLKEVQPNDLKPYPKLETLWMEHNQFEYFESGTFDGNPLLKFIAVSSNKIKHVDDGVFEPLQNLEKLYIEFNPCISRLMRRRGDVIDGVGAIEKQCKDEEFMRAKLQKILFAHAECENDLWSDEVISKLELEVSDVGVESLNEQIKKMMNKHEECKTKTKQVSQEKQRDAASGSEARKIGKLTIFGGILTLAILAGNLKN